jgi:hypothetical protein
MHTFSLIVSSAHLFLHLTNFADGFFHPQLTVMYKGTDNTLYVERARMKKEEKNMTDIRFIEANDKKRRKEEFLELLRREGTEELTVLLDRMLRFLAEMPVDRYHDYRIFRHTGLREYLIHRFLREQSNK